MSKVKNHSLHQIYHCQLPNWKRGNPKMGEESDKWSNVSHHLSWFCKKKLKKFWTKTIFKNTIDSPSSFQVVLRIWRPLPSLWHRGSRLQKSKPLPAEQSSLWGFGCLFSDLLLQITWKRSAFHPNLEKSNVCRKRYKCRLGSDFLFSYFLLAAQVGSPMHYGEVAMVISDHFKQKWHFHFLIHWVLLESPLKKIAKKPIFRLWTYFFCYLGVLTQNLPFLKTNSFGESFFWDQSWLE